MCRLDLQDKSNWEVVVDHDPAFFLEDMAVRAQCDNH